MCIIYCIAVTKVCNARAIRLFTFKLEAHKPQVSMHLVSRISFYADMYLCMLVCVWSPPN